MGKGKKKGGARGAVSSNIDFDDNESMASTEDEGVESKKRERDTAKSEKDENKKRRLAKGKRDEDDKSEGSDISTDDDRSDKKRKGYTAKGSKAATENKGQSKITKFTTRGNQAATATAAGSTDDKDAAFDDVDNNGMESEDKSLKGKGNEDKKKGKNGEDEKHNDQKITNFVIPKNLPQSKAELTKTLKEASAWLRNQKQKSEDEKNRDLDRFASQVISDHVRENSDRLIRSLGACCVADLLHHYAPEAPYDDRTLKSVFEFLLKSIKSGLEEDTTTSQIYIRAHYVLEKMALCKLSCLLVDLPDVPGDDFTTDGLRIEMVKTLLKSISPTHSRGVEDCAVDMISSLLEEMDRFSSPLLDSILCPLLPERRKESERASEICRRVVLRCKNHLRDPISHLVNSILVGSAAAILDSDEIDVKDHIHELVYELHKIDPSLLLMILPNTVAQLQVDELESRRKIVDLLHKIFFQASDDYIRENSKLYSQFLSRLFDKDPEIRKSMVMFAGYSLVSENPRNAPLIFLRTPIGPTERESWSYSRMGILPWIDDLHTSTSTADKAPKLDDNINVESIMENEQSRDSFSSENSRRKDDISTRLRSRNSSGKRPTSMKDDSDEESDPDSDESERDENDDDDDDDVSGRGGRPRKQRNARKSSGGNSNKRESMDVDMDQTSSKPKCFLEWALEDVDPDIRKEAVDIVCDLVNDPKGLFYVTQSILKALAQRFMDRKIDIAIRAADGLSWGFNHHLLPIWNGSLTAPLSLGSSGAASSISGTGTQSNTPPKMKAVPSSEEAQLAAEYGTSIGMTLSQIEAMLGWVPGELLQHRFDLRFPSEKVRFTLYQCRLFDEVILGKGVEKNEEKSEYASQSQASSMKRVRVLCRIWRELGPRAKKGFIDILLTQRQNAQLQMKKFIDHKTRERELQMKEGSDDSLEKGSDSEEPSTSSLNTPGNKKSAQKGSLKQRNKDTILAMEREKQAAFGILSKICNDYVSTVDPMAGDSASLKAMETIWPMKDKTIFNLLAQLSDASSPLNYDRGFSQNAADDLQKRLSSKSELAKCFRVVCKRMAMNTLSGGDILSLLSWMQASYENMHPDSEGTTKDEIIDETSRTSLASALSANRRSTRNLLDSYNQFESACELVSLFSEKFPGMFTWSESLHRSIEWMLDSAIVNERNVKATQTLLKTACVMLENQKGKNAYLFEGGKEPGDSEVSDKMKKKKDQTNSKKSNQIRTDLAEKIVNIIEAYFRGSNSTSNDDEDDAGKNGKSKNDMELDELNGEKRKYPVLNSVTSKQVICALASITETYEGLRKRVFASLVKIIRRQALSPKSLSTVVALRMASTLLKMHKSLLEGSDVNSDEWMNRFVKFSYDVIRRPNYDVDDDEEDNTSEIVSSRRVSKDKAESKRNIFNTLILVKIHAFKLIGSEIVRRLEKDKGTGSYETPTQTLLVLMYKLVREFGILQKDNGDVTTSTSKVDSTWPPRDDTETIEMRLGAANVLLRFTSASVRLRISLETMESLYCFTSTKRGGKANDQQASTNGNKRTSVGKSAGKKSRNNNDEEDDAEPQITQQEYKVLVDSYRFIRWAELGRIAMDPNPAVAERFAEKVFHHVLRTGHLMIQFGVFLVFANSSRIERSKWKLAKMKLEDFAFLKKLAGKDVTTPITQRMMVYGTNRVSGKYLTQLMKTLSEHKEKLKMQAMNKGIDPDDNPAYHLLSREYMIPQLLLLLAHHPGTPLDLSELQTFVADQDSQALLTRPITVIYDHLSKSEPATTASVSSANQSTWPLLSSRVIHEVLDKTKNIPDILDDTGSRLSLMADLARSIFDRKSRASKSL